MMCAGKDDYGCGDDEDCEGDNDGDCNDGRDTMSLMTPMMAMTVYDDDHVAAAVPWPSTLSTIWMVVAGAIGDSQFGL